MEILAEVIQVAEMVEAVVENNLIKVEDFYGEPDRDINSLSLKECIEAINIRHVRGREMHEESAFRKFWNEDILALNNRVKFLKRNKNI